jgi:hypothetical protein
MRPFVLVAAGDVGTFTGNFAAFAVGLLLRR